MGELKLAKNCFLKAINQADNSVFYIGKYVNKANKIKHMIPNQHTCQLLPERAKRIANCFISILEQKNLNYEYSIEFEIILASYNN